MFTSSSRYSTLTQQVARDLEDRIRRGVLRDTLPGERQLAETMQVSRRTIRAATDILREKKLVHTVQGVPTRILDTPVKSASLAPMRSVGMLLPKPLEDLKPFTAVIEGVRSIFFQNGFRLDTHFGQRFLSRRPGAALKRLVAQFPHDGWILASANRACQVWFYAEGIATVVEGTAHEGIPLASMDIDMLATSRHGATILLRAGHRRIALVIEEADWAGHRKTEQGFLEGVKQFGSAAVGRVYKHGGTTADLETLIHRLLQSPAPPTALFIVNPYHYLAVAAILAARGLNVPRDISLLCRDDDACLRYLPVKPCRYAYNAQFQAKQIFAMMIAAVRTTPEKRPTKSVLMLPEYIEGASIAAPR